MKMNGINKLNSDKMDEAFHAKIGHGMDIKIPIPPTSNGNVIMNGGARNGFPPMANGGGMVNHAYDNYLDGHKDTFNTFDGHQQVIEDEQPVCDNVSEMDKEIYYFPTEDGGVVVEDCCPDVIYRVMPCCDGDPDISPFWQVWAEHRLLGNKYVIFYSLLCCFI